MILILILDGLLLLAVLITIWALFQWNLRSRDVVIMMTVLLIALVAVYFVNHLFIEQLITETDLQLPTLSESGG